MPRVLKLILAFIMSCSSVSIAEATPSPFDKLIGVDYQPNHYASTNKFNFHDVFYVGNNSAGTPISNVYRELEQLKAAGFTTVRSYQTEVYSWVDIINQAHALGMKVIYEAVIPQLQVDEAYSYGGCPVAPGSQNYIPCAQATLNEIITQVSKPVFDSTVILVLAGHENYCDGTLPPPQSQCIQGSTNIAYLVSAVGALKTTLANASLLTPVSSALVSGNLTTPSAPIAVDMQTLINSYSADAPLAFDPYPFQWGVVPQTAVFAPPLATTIQPNDTLAWDYLNVVGTSAPAPVSLPTTAAQSFYTPGRVLLAAETGWATQGTTAEYACNVPGPCAPSVANAVTYYQSLYQITNASNFVVNSGYPIGVLAFEAYDEPTKDSSNAEGNYGLFDTNCNQKAAGLVPNNTMVSAPGCQGYANGSLLTLVGFGHPYTINIVQNNPVTGNNASITLTGTGNPGPLGSSDWPQFLVFSGATITIRGNPSCTSTVTNISSAQIITFSGTCNCSNADNNCYY